jgi:hypothetical protein
MAAISGFGSKRRRNSVTQPARAPAKAVADGKVLEWMVGEWCQTCNANGWPHAAPAMAPKEILVGSVCFGSGSDHWVIKAVENVTRELGMQTAWKIVFMVEIVPKKREWILQLPNLDCCLFGDIVDLVERDGFGHCYRHNRFCRVPEYDVHVAGFSCKGWSPQNCKEKDPRTLLSNPSSTSTTYSSFWGNIALIEMRRPWMVVFENLDVMDNEPAPSVKGDPQAC